MITAIKIQGSDAVSMWDVVEPYLEQVLDKGGVDEYGTANILDRVEIGALTLFIIFDTEEKVVKGAFTMSFAQYDNMITATIVHFSADDMDQAIACWPKMVEYAKDMGAKKLTIKGRKGWDKICKKYGFESSAVYYQRAL